MFDAICQIAIASLGVPTIFLLCCKSEKLRKIGILLGVISQPFWIATTLINHQTGMFIMSMFYTLSYFFAFYNHWIKGNKCKSK